MRIHSSFRILATASLVAATFIGCGDDKAPTPTPDTTSADVASGTDTATGDDTATITDTATGTDTATSDDVATGSDTQTAADTTTEPLVFTADITWNGTTTTVVPEVRRGLSWAARPIDKTVSALLGQPLVMDCSPGVPALDGGREIFIADINIAGNFNSICGGNLARIDAAEDSLRLQAANACVSKNHCSQELSESFDLLLGECQPSSILLTAQYRCTPLIPSPVFVFEATVGTDAIRVDSLDALGESNCADRAAGFYLNLQPVTIAEDAPCSIHITSRTDDALAGSITATLVDADGTRHTLAAEFRHDDTPARPIAGVNTGTDLCATNDITHTVETVGDKTIDVFTTGPLQCQVNTATPLPGVGFRRVRPATPTSDRTIYCSNNFDITRGGGSTDNALGGGCRYAAAASNGTGVLRFVFYEVNTCVAVGDCGAMMPYVYMQYDLGATPAN